MTMTATEAFIQDPLFFLHSSIIVEIDRALFSGKQLINQQQRNGFYRGKDGGAVQIMALRIKKVYVHHL